MRPPSTSGAPALVDQPPVPLKRSGQVPPAGPRKQRKGAYYHHITNIATSVLRKIRQVLAGLVPGAIAVAWLPLRGHLPNTDLALVLVVATAAVGFVAGRKAVIVGALGAGSSFDLLHTRPYDQLAIAHIRDVLTTVLLVLAGLAMGEVALRLADYRKALASEVGAFTLVTEAAGLIATGSEASLVLGALTEELARILRLKDCRFRPGLPDGHLPCISRHGGIMHLSLVDAADVPRQVDLPVWWSGEIVGHFQLVLEDGAPFPSPAGLRLAVNISDQAGAALTALGDPQTPPPGDRNHLRLYADRGPDGAGLPAPGIFLTSHRRGEDRKRLQVSR